MGVKDFVLAACSGRSNLLLQPLSKTFQCCASSAACCVILLLVGGTAVATAFGYQGKAQCVFECWPAECGGSLGSLRHRTLTDICSAESKRPPLPAGWKHTDKGAVVSVLNKPQTLILELIFWELVFLVLNAPLGTLE